MVDRIKRETRARMAATGETYTEARRAVLAITPPAPPSPAKLRAAVEVLLAAWAPQTLDADDQDDGYDTNGCNCAGTDEHGNQRGCNCADGCGCPNCAHFRHTESRRCQLPAPRPDQPYARCGEPGQYRIRPYCVNRDSVTRLGSKGDTTAKRDIVRLGDSISHHATTYACTTQHARDLIALDQQRRANTPGDSPLSAARTYYNVENHQYEPDDIDVPGPLHPTRRALESAAYWAGQTIAATYGTGHGTVDDAAEGMLLYTAWAALGAVEYVEHSDQGAADG